MKTFLFWNLAQKDLTANIVSLAKFYQVDVFMFAECAIPPQDLLQALNLNNQLKYHDNFSICEKIKIFTRFPSNSIQPIYETKRLTIRHLQLSTSLDILLAVTHFVDKRNWDEDSQNAECIELAANIEKAERRMGHNRTILVEDLNMNPFQAGLVLAKGLNAVMSGQIALEGSRSVQGKQYKFFYNPMWNLLGDSTSNPPGTYYLRQAVHKVYFWHMFDQVLVRPELLEFFDYRHLAILAHDGTVSLATAKGYPNKKRYSDHFPIIFKLDHLLNNQQKL